MIKFSEGVERKNQILLIGIGGAGSSVIDKINNYSLSGIDTFFIDTDADCVNASNAKEIFCIPNRLIKGLYSEANNVIASQELTKELKTFLDSLPRVEMVFTVSGLGGNTGSAITPYLVQILKEKADWVWCLCTIPFFFEGKPKITNSLKRIKLLQQSANAVMVIPHDKIFKMVDKNLSMNEAFSPANNLCAELVLSVHRLTQHDTKNNSVNIKFSDIKQRITTKRSTSFGIGEATGESRIQMAMEQAISSPLIDKNVLNSAEGLILSISSDKMVTLDEVNNGIKYLHKLIPKDIDIIFGVSVVPVLKNKVRVGIITTGIDTNSNVDNWDMSLSTSFTEKDIGPIRRAPILNRPMRQSQKAKQTMIDFKKLQKGRFEKSEATVYGGEDLDVPTFLRKKK